MGKLVELIWEFRGPAAKATAQHHLIHLAEFAKSEQLDSTVMELVEQRPQYFQAIWVVAPEHVDDLRTRLKPHRGRYRQ